MLDSLAANIVTLRRSAQACIGDKRFLRATDARMVNLVSAAAEKLVETLTARKSNLASYWHCVADAIVMFSSVVVFLNYT